MPKQKTRAPRIKKKTTKTDNIISSSTPPQAMITRQSDKHAEILNMQRQYGNAYVQRHLIQREGGDPAVAEETSESEQLQETIYEDFTLIRGELWDAQKQNFTTRRRTLINEIGMLVANLGEKTVPQLQTVETKMVDFQDNMVDETLNARTVWEDLESWYVEELETLEGETDYAAVMAMDLLTKEYENSKKNVDKVDTWLFDEDFLGLFYMLEHSTHIAKGEEIATQEEMENEKVLEGFDPDEEEEPGILSTAWDVFGWDSFGDFAVDALITVGTAGVGKALRYGYKAHKARKAYKRVKRVKQALKVKKIAKAANGIDNILELLDANADDQIANMFTWMQGNWTKIAKKVGTDLAAEGLAGEDGIQNIGTDIVERATKEYLGEIVTKFLGKDSKWEKKMARHAFAASISSRTRKRAKTLFIAYFSQNAKRRVLTNCLHKSLIETASFENPLDASWLDDALISAAMEMAQDLVGVLPLFDNSLASSALETVRKTLVEKFKR